MSLGQNIARVRKSRNLKQVELASKLHVHPSMVTRWERDQVAPRGASLEKLAEALETSPEALMVDADTETGSHVTIRNHQDAQLGQLLQQIPSLAEPEIHALKTILEAMLTKSKIREFVN